MEKSTYRVLFCCYAKGGEVLKNGSALVHNSYTGVEAQVKLERKLKFLYKNTFGRLATSSCAALTPIEAAFNDIKKGGIFGSSIFGQ